MEGREEAGLDKRPAAVVKEGTGFQGAEVGRP